MERRGDIRAPSPRVPKTAPITESASVPKPTLLPKHSDADDLKENYRRMIEHESGILEMRNQMRTIGVRESLGNGLESLEDESEDWMQRYKEKLEKGVKWRVQWVKDMGEMNARDRKEIDRIGKFSSRGMRALRRDDGEWKTFRYGGMVLVMMGGIAVLGIVVGWLWMYCATVWGLHVDG